MMDQSHLTPPTVAAPIADPAAPFALYDEHQSREAELRPQNHGALFAVLAAAGIVDIVVGFDGYADSGQIESVDARDASGPVDLPAVCVMFVRHVWGEVELQDDVIDVASAIERVVYDLLNETHGGWENNDGAYGEFTFDVAACAIRLEYNARYTATETYNHEF